MKNIYNHLQHRYKNKGRIQANFPTIISGIDYITLTLDMKNCTTFHSTSPINHLNQWIIQICYKICNQYLSRMMGIILMFVQSINLQGQVYNGHLSLTTQVDVDNFNFSAVTGNLYIGGSDIVDLTPLSSLTTIGGSLSISNNTALTNLNGLQNLASIGGNFLVQYNKGLVSLVGLENLTALNGRLYIQYNEGLTSVNGLDGLSSINGSLYLTANREMTKLMGFQGLISINGSLIISHNDQLDDVDGLQSLELVAGSTSLHNNDALVHISGLNKLKSIGRSLSISSNQVLNNLDGFQSLNAAESLIIDGNSMLSNVDGLQNLTQLDADLLVENNPLLTNLNGFQYLTSIGGTYKISSNFSLTNLNGFQNLIFIGKDLEVSFNDNLISLEGLQNITAVPMNLIIKQNPKLADITSLHNITSIGSSLIIEQNEALLSLMGLQNLTSVNENVSISGNVNQLQGLKNLTTIGGSLLIRSNQNLTSLNGLENLSFIATNITIRNNPNLINLSGLHSIQSISGSISIEYNEQLINLEGLDELTSVGLNVHIENNDALISLSGLQNLTSVGGNFQLDKNASLQSMDGLQNLTSIGVDFRIENNVLLKDLNGLSRLVSVGRHFTIYFNPAFENLDGLSSLESVGLDLDIWGNGGLSQLDGLSSLMSVGRILVRQNNSLLTLNGLQNLGIVTQGVIIRDNGSLENLDGFKNLKTCYNYILIKNNESLLTLNGLRNLEKGYASVIVQNNASLASCCGLYPPLISGFLIGRIFVSNNGSGCSSEQDILDNCSWQSPDCGGIQIQDKIADHQCQAILSAEDVTGVINPNNEALSITVFPEILSLGENHVTVTLENGYGGSCSKDIIVRVVNDQMPRLLNLNVPIDPVSIGSSTSISVDYEDNNLVEAIIDWGDGAISYGDIQETTISGKHSYTIPGVYVLSIKVWDACGETTEIIHQYIVIYDPAGGFVTGGGWIYSPVGAYPANPLLEGKANFGFVAKYKKGQSIPAGNTEFQFKAGDLHFKSSSYQWLVIAGTQAKFKGEGQINGLGTYGFMLSAVDGQIKGGGSPDKFRIKIWEKSSEVVVYDNQLGDEENTEPLTILGGGSITIHDGKNEIAKIEKTESIHSKNMFTGQVLIYPNPFQNKISITLASDIEKEHLKIELYSLTGMKIDTPMPIFDHQNSVNMDLFDLPKGTYLILIQNGIRSYREKLIKL